MLLQLLSVAKFTHLQNETIAVPSAQRAHVDIDGIFTTEEWDDALLFTCRDQYRLYLKASEQKLFVGLKAPEPIGELVCEIRYTINNEEVHLLHVSGALGEGLSGFPAVSEFDINNNIMWDANFLKADSLKERSWIAAGRPIDEYDEVYNKRDGIEFAIDRQKLNTSSILFTIGWVRVEVVNGKPDMRSYNFPDKVTFETADTWIELVLPD